MNVDPVVVVEYLRQIIPETTGSPARDIDVVYLVAIMYAENHGADVTDTIPLPTDVVFGPNTNGTFDVGILQINDIWGLTQEQRKDWQLSVRFAVERIVKWHLGFDQANPLNTDRFGPWAAYWNAKNHFKHLDKAWLALRIANQRRRVRELDAELTAVRQDFETVREENGLLIAEVRALTERATRAETALASCNVMNEVLQTKINNAKEALA